jgi:hypothetical protein
MGHISRWPIRWCESTGDNADTVKKITHTLIYESKEVGLEVNPEKNKYMLLSCHQNAGQIHYINLWNICSENVALFRYLGTTKQIDTWFRTKLRDIELCWCLQPFSPELLSSRLLSKNKKFRIYVKNYNFTCGSVWVWNFFSDIKGGT